MPRKRLFPPLDPQTGRRLESKGRDEHTVLTVNGRVTLCRRRWSAPGTGSATPLDALLDIAEASITVGVREMACRLNKDASNFDKAAENLARAAQVTLSGEFLRQVVEAEGRAVLKAQQARTLTIPWTAADCLIPGARDTPAAAASAAAPAAAASAAAPAAAASAAAPAAAAKDTRVYLGSDGVKVPLITDAEKQARRHKVKQKRRRRGKKCRPLPRSKPGADQRYKEFKIVTYYDDAQEHRHVSVTQGDCQVAGALMRRDASCIRLDTAGDKVGVVDGADWIRNQIKGQSLPLDVIELDFYHLADNVHKARRVAYGEEEAGATDTPGQQWAARVLHVAKHEGYEALRDHLVAWKAGLRGARKRKAAEVLIAYVTDRREMVAYPEYLAAGRQIGSGPTESMCKTTTKRLKGVGMRWDADSAEALMALDALDQSGEWKHYWRLCLKPVA
jgi:hypothetical protein